VKLLKAYLKSNLGDFSYCIIGKSEFIVFRVHKLKLLSNQVAHRLSKDAIQIIFSQAFDVYADRQTALKSRKVNEI
jgi:hypothetical protein